MHRFDIELLDHRSRGAFYRVYHDGQVLIDRTHKPAADGCRALVALGITGPVQMWGNGKHRMSFPDVEKAALFTTSEGEMSGPRVIKYVPFDREVFNE
jgi:hypothetical protein